jgi:type I restriction enzyme S subunit
MTALPQDWEDLKIKDVARIGDGAHASIQRLDEGVLYLSSKNFDLERLNLSQVDYISQEDYEKHFRAESKAITKPLENDVLLGIIGSLGAPYLVKKSDLFGLSSSVAIIRSDQSLVDPNYLYYWFKSPTFQLAINQIKSGVAQSFLSLGMIGNLPCYFPKNLEHQKNIASILASYEDLIENNLKRIKLLEEMAQITYEEWFVRMKFPGHEAAIFDEKTGLPEGWAKRPISDFCEKITDGTHDSPKQVEQGVPLITGKHIENGFINFDSAYLISYEDHEKIKKRSGLSHWDILFSNIGTLGNTGVVTENFEYSCKNVVIFKRKHGFEYFLYSYLSNEHTVNKLDNMSSGVAQKFYSLKFIRALEETLPSDDLIKEFNTLAEPIYAAKFKLNNQIKLLKEARDTLLPRLMTGMIDIEQVELPEAMLQRLELQEAEMAEA